MEGRAVEAGRKGEESGEVDTGAWLRGVEGWSEEEGGGECPLIVLCRRVSYGES